MRQSKAYRQFRQRLASKHANPVLWSLGAFESTEDRTRSTVDFSSAAKLLRHFNRVELRKLPAEQWLYYMGKWLERMLNTCSMYAANGGKSLYYKHKAENELMNLRNGEYRAAKAGEFYLCKCCGKPSLFDSYSNKPDERGFCFSCDHWINRFLQLQKTKLSIRDKKVTVAIGRSGQYDLLSFAPGMQTGNFRGFGGSEFYFQLPDGCTWSNNVWSGGYVPPHFEHWVMPFVVEQIIPPSKRRPQMV